MTISPTQEAVGRFRELAKKIVIIEAGGEWYRHYSEGDFTLRNLDKYKKLEAFLVKELSAAYERGRKEGIKLESKKHCRFIGVTTIDGKRWCEEAVLKKIKKCLLILKK